MPYRSSSWRAKRSTRGARGWGLPSSETGQPTTSRPGRHSASSAPIALKRAAPIAAMGCSGCAVRSRASPTATPVRRSPKSNARTVESLSEAEMRDWGGRVAPAWPDMRRSGMTRFVLQAGKIDAQQLHRRRQPLLDRRIEDDRVLGLDREPRVLRQLVLELARRPAGVAERHQDLGRAFAAADGLENVLGGGQPDRLTHPERGLPLAGRRVQHEPAVGLHGSAEKNRRIRQLAVAQREREALEQRLHGHVDGAIHHYAERALLIVLAHVSQRPRKIRIDHVRHGDQEVMRQIDRGHAWRYFSACHWIPPRWSGSAATCVWRTTPHCTPR